MSVQMCSIVPCFNQLKLGWQNFIRILVSTERQDGYIVDERAERNKIIIRKYQCVQFLFRKVIWLGAFVMECAPRLCPFPISKPNSGIRELEFQKNLANRTAFGQRNLNRPFWADCTFNFQNFPVNCPHFPLFIS